MINLMIKNNMVETYSPKAITYIKAGEYRIFFCCGLAYIQQN